MNTLKNYAKKCAEELFPDSVSDLTHWHIYVRTQAMADLKKKESIILRHIETAVSEAKERERVAIESWDEERKRALREAGRVIEANRLLDRAFGFVINMPLAGEISDYLAQFESE